MGAVTFWENAQDVNVAISGLLMLENLTTGGRRAEILPVSLGEACQAGRAVITKAACRWENFIGCGLRQPGFGMLGTATFQDPIPTDPPFYIPVVHFSP